MKRNHLHTIIAAALLLVASAQPCRAAVTPDQFIGTNSANGSLVLTSLNEPAPAFVGSSEGGTIDLTPLVPVPLLTYGTGSFFFFETGEGTADGISLSGISGYIPRLTINYLQAPSMQLTLLDEPTGSPVPVPAAILLLASGMAALAGLRNRTAEA